jgi:hypothetical protein
LRRVACLAGAAALLTSLTCAQPAHATGPVVLTAADSHAAVHVGDVVRVHLTSDAPGDCPTGWGPVHSSDQSVLAPTGNGTSGSDATGDFRAATAGTARLTSAQVSLPTHTSSDAPVACPALARLWLATVVVQGQESDESSFSGREVGALAAVGGASFAAGLVALAARRRRDPA